MDTKNEIAYKLGAEFGKSVGFVILSIPFTLFMTWVCFDLLGIEWCFDYGFAAWIMLALLRFFVVD